MSADAHLLDGLAHARAGRLFAAEDSLRQALDASGHVHAAANLAAVLQLQGRPGDACAVLHPHLKSGAHHPVGWNTLGVSLMDQGHLVEAAGCFQRAASQDPTNVLPMVHLYGALFDDRDPAPARGVLEQAARVERTHPAVRFHLGVTWGLLAPEAAKRHHAVLPPDAQAWRDSWAFVLQARDPHTRFFASTAATLRYAAEIAPADGFVAELGVRFGTTACLLRDATGAPVHGFDTFVGLPADWHTVPAGAYSTGGHVPDLGPDIHLHAGLFRDTVPAFSAAQGAPARLVNIDCDLKSSTVEGLEPLAPHLQPGTVLVFDEYLMNPHWRDDEHAALVELGRRHGWRWRYAAFSLLSHQAVVVLTDVGA
jgi:tetratricopeptide (TPR) repeat protein